MVWVDSMFDLCSAVGSWMFRRDRPRRWFTVGMLLVLVWSSTGVAACTDVSHLKAVLLERFTRFVQWPDDTTAIDSTQPFAIAIAGDTNFARTVRSVYESVAIHGRPVEVMVATATDIPACSILYIGCSVSERLLALLERLQDKPILTVSQCASFPRRGVHINFYVTGKDRLRFEVNTPAVAASGLKMSHLLLDVARIVDPSKQED